MIGAMNSGTKGLQQRPAAEGLQQSALKRSARHFGKAPRGEKNSIYLVLLFCSACDNYCPQIENYSLRGPPLAYLSEAAKQEEGRRAKGQSGVILVAFKGSAHFCLTDRASSVLTGVLFHKGI